MFGNTNPAARADESMMYSWAPLNAGESQSNEFVEMNSAFLFMPSSG